MEFFADIDFTPQRVSVILMLVAFVATFLITRGITRRIRSQRLADAQADGAEEKYLQQPTATVLPDAAMRQRPDSGF